MARVGFRTMLIPDRHVLYTCTRSVCVCVNTVSEVSSQSERGSGGRGDAPNVCTNRDRTVALVLKLLHVAAGRAGTARNTPHGYVDELILRGRALVLGSDD